MAVHLLNEVARKSGLLRDCTAMTCRTAVGTICNYLEGTLSPQAVVDLREHLEACKDCQLVLDAAQRTLEIDFDRAESSNPSHTVTSV